MPPFTCTPASKSQRFLIRDVICACDFVANQIDCLRGDCILKRTCFMSSVCEAVTPKISVGSSLRSKTGILGTVSFTIKPRRFKCASLQTSSKKHDRIGISDFLANDPRVRKTDQQGHPEQVHQTAIPKM